MSQSSDTDANGSVIFVAEQHTVRVDVYPVPNPQKPYQYSPQRPNTFHLQTQLQTTQKKIS